MQSGWILTGALDWARLLLREDHMGSGATAADHLGEPWAVPLQEARLSSFLAADRNGADEILRAQRLNRGKRDRPARVPPGHHLVARGRRRHFEFGVAVPVRLFAVGRQEVGPTGHQVTGHVLHDHGDRVCILIERQMEFVISHLCDGSIRFVANAIVLATWTALSSQAGGEVAGSY